MKKVETVDAEQAAYDRFKAATKAALAAEKALQESAESKAFGAAMDELRSATQALQKAAQEAQ